MPYLNTVIKFTICKKYFSLQLHDVLLIHRCLFTQECGQYGRHQEVAMYLAVEAWIGEPEPVVDLAFAWDYR